MESGERNTPREGRVIVIGGGAAGLVAAMRAAEGGASVLLLEKTERLGTKILISGGGKCNVTHTGSMEQVRAAFRRNEALFLKPSFYRYTNQDFVKLLQSTGLPTAAREDGRVFPREPGNAKDVVAALESIVRRAGVEIVTNTPVTGLRLTPGGVFEVECGGDIMQARQVVIAAGGSSYPATGTTGDGWRWAESLGHTIVTPRAALAPIYLRDARPDWSGVALRDVELLARVSAQGKIYTRWRGDLLYTHKGISGPSALGISRDIVEQIGRSPERDAGILTVDFRAHSSFEALVAELKVESLRTPRRSLRTYLADTVPNRLTDAMLAKADSNSITTMGQLSQKSTLGLVRQIKEWNLGAVKAVPLERGEVVAGGICLDEVESKTMASKQVAGLYLCGEVLDIAGPVGGYNLQAAWSTGYVAGESAALAAMKH